MRKDTTRLSSPYLRNGQDDRYYLVFEAAFTEIHVQINGRKAGNGLYQGGFTRHTIDVSDRVFFGKKKNRLEVEVSERKHQSAGQPC